jgi:hypothetical protein
VVIARADINARVKACQTLLCPIFLDQDCTSGIISATTGVLFMNAERMPTGKHSLRNQD